LIFVAGDVFFHAELRGCGADISHRVANGVPEAKRNGRTGRLRP
jgi:hypothetical protein